MLHRSFKPAKCKTALKLAVSRMKLLKNKKDAQVKQIKRELAQMMESGQYRTARIRVEHVVREEKLKAAYELVEIYCELIAARLPMVEAQKNCPIDLKEAVSSVMFASPRCSDVPELMDIRKHFTAKYGKEFVNAAVELRPDSGVSRMLIEKLSTKSPDGPTKMKILAAIAEEHNVKWDPEAFEEKPPEDLLNGPNTFGMATLDSAPPPPSHDVRVPPNVQVPPSSMVSRAHVEPPPGPPPPDHQPPNAQVPRRKYEYHDGSMNSNEQNARSPPRAEDSASTNISVNKATTSAKFHPETTSSGTRSDRMEMHAFPGDDNSSGRQNWNMQFKDAASAAQAAAESAERAGMAARAAAELSRQYSSEMHNRSNQSASVPANTSSINDHLVNNLQTADRYPQNKSPEHQRHDRLDKVSMKRQSGDSEDMHTSEIKAAIKPENIPYFGDVRSEKKSSKSSSPSNSSIGSGHQEDVLKEDNINYFADLGTGKQSIRSPSPPRSGQVSNSHGNFSRVSGNDSFVSDVNIHQSTIGMTSEGNASLVFDDSGSDDDNYKGQESSLFFSSPARNSFPSASLDPWGFEQKAEEVPFKSVSPLRSSPVQHSVPVFSEGLTGSTVSSEPNDFLPVTFDASDGPSSDSEEELEMSKLVPSKDSNFSHEKTVQSVNSWKSQGASHRSLASPSYYEVHPESRQGIEHTVFSDKEFDDNKFPSSEPSQRLKKSGLDTNAKDHLPQTVKDSEECSCVSDTDNELLAYGVLKGGLRNKGLKHPPYNRNPSGYDSSVKQDTPPVRISNVSPMSSEDPYSRKGTTKLHKEQSTKTPVAYVPPDDDSSEDELSHETLSSSRQGLYNQKSVSQVALDDSSEDEFSHEILSSSGQDLYHQKSVSKKKTSSTSAFFFNSEDSEAEEDLPRKISTTITRPIAKFSRRTQPSSSSSVRSSSSRTSVVPDAPRTSDYGMSSSRSSNATETVLEPSGSQEWQRPIEQPSYSIPKSKKTGTSVYQNVSSRSSSATEAPPSDSSPIRSSERLASQEWRRPVEQAAPKPKPESKRSSRVETSKSFEREQSSNTRPMVVRSERTGATETSRPSGSKSFGREESSNPPKIGRSESSESSQSSGFKSFARDQSSNIPAKVVKPERTEPSKFSPPKSFTREQTSNPTPKIVRSQSTETSNSSSSAGKASHVHPKLPDSDDLFAQFAALKQNRQ